MTLDEVKKEIDKDKSAFYNARCKHKLPKKFTEYFKRALFAVSPRADNIASASIKLFIETPVKELSFGQASKMLDVITGVVREKVFDSFEEALEQLPEFEQLMKVFMEDVAALNERLKKKEHALIHMTGTRKQPKSKQKPQLQSVK